MPTHGEAKIKDMCESILPSTRRKGAREDRKTVHRNTRRRVRRWDGENEKFDPLYDPTHKVREIMWDRRQGDKLGGFIRWATAITKDLPLEKRLPHIKRLLPDNLIGRHAISHLVYLDHFAVPQDHEFWLRPRSNRTTTEFPLAEKLYEVIAGGNLKAFNLAIKKAHTSATWSNRWFRTDAYKWVRIAEPGHRVFDKATRSYHVTPCSCRPRVLLGAHDVNDFIAEITKSQHREWKKAVDAFFQN